MICPFCHNEITKSTIDEITVTINGKQLIIDNIPAKICSSCKTVFHDKTASKFIDEQVRSFKILNSFKIIKKDNKYQVVPLP